MPDKNNNIYKLHLPADRVKRIHEYIDKSSKLMNEEPPGKDEENPTEEFIKWKAQVDELNAEYHDDMRLFISSCLTVSNGKSGSGFFLVPDDQVTDSQPPAISEKPLGLLANDFLPLLNNATTNELVRVNIKDFTKDKVTNRAKYSHGNVTFEISNFNTLYGPMETSAKKLLDTAILYLANNNYGRNITQPVVLIPLIEYGEANGLKLTPQKLDNKEEQEKENARVQERIKRLKNNIRRDLENIQNTRYTTTETKGRNKGNYIDQGIISSHAIIREKGTTYIRVTFDYTMAKYLANSYIAQFPTSLLKIDNRNDNAYAIGRKIATHNSIDKNYSAGTANTLKVSTLIDSAPEIQTYDELKESGQRNWKLRIKDPLEKSLNENIDVGVITQWQYRDPKTKIIYTPKEANSLSWTEYISLDVDYELKQNPKQEERRKRKDSEQPITEPKKRGRPRKKPPEE